MRQLKSCRLFAVVASLTLLSSCVVYVPGLEKVAKPSAKAVLETPSAQVSFKPLWT